QVSTKQSRRIEGDLLDANDITRQGHPGFLDGRSYLRHASDAAPASSKENVARCETCEIAGLRSSDRISIADGNIRQTGVQGLGAIGVYQIQTRARAAGIGHGFHDGIARLVVVQGPRHMRECCLCYIDWLKSRGRRRPAVSLTIAIEIVKLG